MALIRANRESIDDRFSVLGFTVRSESPLFEIGLATDPELLKAENRARRTASNFYSSRVLGSGARRGDAVYLVPPSVVARFVGQPRLYFGLATYNEGDRSRPVSVKIPDAGNMYVNLSGLTERGLRRTARLDTVSGYGGAANGGLAWGGDALDSGAARANGNGRGNGAAAAPAAPAPYSDGYSDDLWQQGASAPPAPASNGHDSTAPAAAAPAPAATPAPVADAAPATAQSYGRYQQRYDAPAPRTSAPNSRSLLVSSYYRPSNWFDALTTQIGFFVSSAIWFLGVTDTTVPPHSAICQVRRPDGSEEGALHGSAFFIGPCLLLTAAHVVDGQSELIIVPGKNGAGVSGATEPFGRFHVTAADCRKHPSYSAGNSDFDMAVIRVPAANAVPADRTFDLVEELTQSRPEGVVVCGYSARWYANDAIEQWVNDNIDPNKQHMHGGYIRSLPSEETFDYDLQTLGGASGSPVYWIEGGTFPRAHMVGVHVAAHSATTNLGCRITAAKRQWIAQEAAGFGIAFSLAQRAAPRAQALGGGKVYARAQEIITPFYDPADPSTALSCQADAFSLAREEWFAGVPNTSLYPHSAICQLLMTAPDGSGYQGTGFYIGRNRILTCAHNLHGMSSVQIIPGRNGAGGRPYGQCTVQSSSWRVAPRYSGDGDWNNDLAVIDNVPIAAPNGQYFEFLQATPSDRLPVVVCGYSAASRAVPELDAIIDGDKQHLHGGYVREQPNPETLDYPILSLMGASGSPVYTLADRGGLKALICAVHVSGEPAAQGLNRGCFITPSKIDWIEGRATTFALGMPASPRANGRTNTRAFALEDEEQDNKGISEAIPDETVAAEQSYRHARAFDAPTAEYPGASRFAPAYSGNYRAMRTPRTVDRIVIHITDGGSRITGTIGWFQNPDQRNSRNEHITVSAHYVIGRDGEVVQMVRNNDVAWHASSANTHGIGIEHVANKRGLDPTEAQYQASAALVAWLCAQYNLPIDREHIVGHQEASPRDNHDCPSRLWNWDHYMDCVRAAAAPATAPATSQGLRGRGRANALALPGRPYATAQEIITPFYDPSNPMSALTCQDDAFSLAREEWFVGVEDTRAFPHSAICQLLMTDSAGNGWGGTGFYIGPNRILTCAHNLHNKVNVTVVPGQNGAGVKPFGQCTLPSSSWRIAPRYSGSGNWENDLAVIDNVPIAAPNGQYFEFLNATPSDRLPIVVCGYSGASDAVPELTAAIDGDKQHLHGGYAASQSNGEVIEYPILTLHGASGSPVYHLDRSSGQLKAQVCAVHVTGQPAAQGLNRGCFITPTKIDWIEGRATTFALGAGRPVRALSESGSDYPVTLVPQPNKDACWAASMAMLLSWRHNQSYSPETLANQVGGSLASSYGWDLLNAVRDRYGFSVIPQPSNTSLYHTPTQWAQWLRERGALWVVIVGAPHAVVIAGIKGNLEDPASVQVKVLNPWDTRVAFDSDAVDFHPANHGYEDWLPFADFAADFGNMAEPDYGNWRVLYLPPEAPRPSAQSLGSGGGLRLARPPSAVRAFDVGSDASASGETREPIEPSRVAGTRMSVLRGSAGACRWALDQLEGLKSPAVLSPSVSSTAAADVRIELGEWPAIEGQSSPLPITVDFRASQGSVGEVRVIAGLPANLAYGVEASARIEDAPDVGGVAALKLSIDYRFSGLAQGSPAARIELRLLGDGRYERENRWVTTA
ncbi:hypothetical protein ASE35_13650 [Lysobacter sp. Root916]|uniref:N-acetylmuramoyl-L-alanine amidase n=1 Tax=Lysobacter sp. Root916 TaxID=1736606 RepID=UPI00070C4E28|nr:N-acetylmuramoyl-L-alanine amidase [Lysobacter sp. Root916]KRD31996.1 hypothetical protein ASE35_13650 [Lysobacter sp. Root916]